MKNIKKIIVIVAIVSFLFSNRVYATILPVGQGGTGWGNPAGFQAGKLLYGNGLNPIATTSGEVTGYVLNWNGTKPTWVATSSLGISGTPYPFPLTGNATSTLTQFNGGLTAYASSTIGDGTNGLTISGNATTTGLAYFGGSVGVGVQAPQATADILMNSATLPGLNVINPIPGTNSGNIAYFAGNSSGAYTYIDRYGRLYTTSIAAGLYSSLSGNGPFSWNGGGFSFGYASDNPKLQLTFGNTTASPTYLTFGARTSDSTTQNQADIYSTWNDSTTATRKGVLSFGTYNGTTIDNFFNATDTGSGVTVSINPNGGNVGIGTSSPSLNFGFDIGTTTLMAGSITNTSTATSTFAGGINLTGGCLSVGGTCIGGGSGTNYFTNASTLTYLNTGTTLSAPTINATSTLQIQGWTQATSTVVCFSPQTCQYQATTANPELAINSAINAANAAGGGTVIVRAGNYHLNNPVFLKSNVILTGEGPSTIIYATTTLNAGFAGIVDSTTTSTRITNLTVDGSGQSNGSYNGDVALYVNDSIDAKIDHVNIRNANGFGMFVVTTGLSTSASPTTTAISITNNYLTCNGNQDCIGGGPDQTFSGPTQNVLIANNQIQQTIQSGRTGIDVDSDLNCADMVAVNNVSFTGNICNGQFIFGEEKYPNTNSSISNNVMAPALGPVNIASEIILLQRNNPTGSANIPRNISIQGNTIHYGNILIEGTSNNPYQNLNVSNNTIDAAPASYQNQDFVANNGIKVDHTKNSSFTNNVITANASSTTGIILDSSVTNTTVSGGSVNGFNVGVDLGNGVGNSVSLVNFVGDTTNIQNAPAVFTLNGTSYGFATTSPSLNFGFDVGTTTLFHGALFQDVNATSTFAGGINITAGCFSINNTCVGGGSGGSGTVTSVGLSSTNSTLSIGSTPVTTSGTITADLNLGHANSWTALQQFANASSSLLSANYAQFGAYATTTIDTYGNIILPTNARVHTPETNLATSTSMTVYIASSSAQLIRYGTSATTVTISTAGATIGDALTLTLCGPGSGTPGTITFAGLEYSNGIAPSNTTTAGYCDVAYIITTNASTTAKAFLTGFTPGIN